jgi:hypothetical protein
MQRVLPATILLLAAGFTVITFYNLAGGSNMVGPLTGTSAAPRSTSQSENPPGAGESNQITRVDFQDSQPLTLSWNNTTKYRTTVFVRNDEAVAGSLHFSATLEDNQRRVLSDDSRVSSKPLIVDANSITLVCVEVDVADFSAPLSGYLKLTATSSSDRKSSIKYRAIRVPPPMPSVPATVLFWISFACPALVALAAVWALKRKGISIKQRMGSPTWSFGDSWGTNIAVGGALLNTLVSFSALPDQTHYLNKISYICLSMIFGAVITVAPSFYALVRTAVTIPGPGGSSAIQYQGYVGFFALASAVIAWGAIGQVVTVALLFLELWTARTISLSVLSCLAVMFGIVGLLLLVYECRTIVQTARLQKAAATKGGGGVAGTYLPSWSLP